VEKIKKTLFFIKNNTYIKLLIIILSIGAILRFYGLHNAENTDEYNEVMEALRVASGRFNYERWMKKGFQNLLAVEFGIYFIIGYLINIFSSPVDFAEKVVRDMEPLFLIGRYTVASMGVASIALVYMLGKQIYNARVGLIAALFLSVASLHVWTSHLVNTDVPLTFFFLLSLYFVVKFYSSGKLIDYIVAAFFGAVTINIKLTGVGIGFIFIVAHIIRCNDQQRSLINYIFCKEILYSFIAFIIGLIISNPPIVIGLKEFIQYNYAIYANVYDEIPYAIDDNAYFTYLVLLTKEFGIPLFLLSIASLSYAIYKRESWDYIFIIYLIGIYLILSSTTFLVQDRYLMTLIPILYLLNARLIDSVINKITLLSRQKIISLTIVCVLVLLIPVTNSIVYVRTLTDENTSKVSKKWIEKNIPAGSNILMDAGRTIITSGPRLHQSREKLEEKLNIIRNLKEGETYDSPMVKIVDSYSSIYFELLLKNIPEITYNITSTELGRKIESIEYYKNNGFDYFIHNKALEFRIKDTLWRQKYPKSAKFYDSIDEEFELIKIFRPSETRSGSTIVIYKIN